MAALAWFLRARCARFLVAIAILDLISQSADARNYLFENITDLPGGPGSGDLAEVNDSGDIAFVSNGDVWLYDRSESSFLNVTALPGAPQNPIFVKINNSADIAILETPASTQDVWLFQRDTQTFTNINSLPGHPGDSQAHFSDDVFDINDSRQISFHSGDHNFGSVYVYSHATGAFDWINGKPGASSFARENEINNLGQVAYMGFPSIYLYDPTVNTTTNINALPGGSGTTLTNVDLNDLGDVFLFSARGSALYNASSQTFLDIDATPGWPDPNGGHSDSDLGNGGGATFSLSQVLYAFDINTKRFSQLANFPGGLQGNQPANDVNNLGQIVITAGTDVFLGTPRPYGDYDNDGDVDASDLALWETTYESAAAIGTGADGNSDSQINGLDFLVWQRAVGGGVPLQSAAAVPEPATAVLLITMVLGMNRRRYRVPLIRR